MDISFTVTDDPLKGAPLLSAILTAIISNANNEKEMEKKIGRNDFFTARAKPVCKFRISKQLMVKQFFMKLKIFIKQKKKIQPIS